jgi:hypothetical protein
VWDSKKRAAGIKCANNIFDTSECRKKNASALARLGSATYGKLLSDYSLNYIMLFKLLRAY